jgi:hypothetical protein
MVPWLHWTILNWSKGRETGIDKIDVLPVNNIDRLVNGNKKTYIPVCCIPRYWKQQTIFWGSPDLVAKFGAGFTGFTASFGLVPASTLEQTLVGRKKTW